MRNYFDGYSGFFLKNSNQTGKCVLDVGEHAIYQFLLMDLGTRSDAEFIWIDDDNAEFQHAMAMQDQASKFLIRML